MAYMGPGDMVQFDYNMDLSGGAFDALQLLEELKQQHPQQLNTANRSEKVTLEAFVVIKMIGKDSFGIVQLSCDRG
ncbi:hypothetical protein BBJ28_00021283 [Nothophytophthora sp. Chile5]|nr:hypothetical protein BBJ28_00021283 [Nothophytophthora sp. Chile5]